MGHAELRAIHHDHEFVRQSLALIRAAIAGPVAPPEGHAYWGILYDAASYLASALPGHMEVEETRIFPLYRGLPGADRLDGLVADHRALEVQVMSLLEAIGRWALEGPDARWPETRRRATRLEAALADHLAREEALLRHLGRGEAVA